MSAYDDFQAQGCRSQQKIVSASNSFESQVGNAELPWYSCSVPSTAGISVLPKVFVFDSRP